MDARQLEVFLEACRLGTLTAAARALAMSEQSASKLMAALEAELGTTLLVRGGRGVAPTADGEALQGEARSYVAHHRALLQRFREPQEGGRRVLGIAAATGVMAQWLPEHFVADFAQANPDVRVEVFCNAEDSYNRPRHALGRDVILCSSLLPMDGWSVALHRRAPMRILVDARHPFARRGSIELRELAGMHVAMSIDETPEQLGLARRLERVGARLAMRIGPAEIPLVNDMMLAEPIDDPLVTLFGGSATRVPEGIAVVDVEGLDMYWDFYALRRDGAACEDSVARFFAAMERVLPPE